MILSYEDKQTEAFAQGEFVRAFQGFAQQAERWPAILNAAPSLDTLRALPGNRLDALKGGRAGQYSIRINQQWRLCFEWPDGQPGPVTSRSWIITDKRSSGDVQARRPSRRDFEG